MKKLLLSLAAIALGFAANATSVTQEFKAGLGFPEGNVGAVPTEAVSVTASDTGIKYTLLGTNVSPNNYLMISGKNVPGAYISFSLDFNCAQILLTTTSGGSQNAQNTVNIYANDNKIVSAFPVNILSTTFAVNIPEEYQAAGTVYKVESNTTGYNTQFASFTYNSEATETPTPGPGDDDAIFSWTVGGAEVWSFDIVSGTQSPWSYSNQYGLYGSAYNNDDKNVTAIAASPVIDLTSEKEAYLSFKGAYNFFGDVANIPDYCQIVVREEGASAWTLLENAVTAPSSLGWSFIENDDIDLAAYVGKKMQFGFQYISSDDVCGTWEIKDIVVSSSAAVPPTPPTPTEGVYYYKSFEDNLDGWEKVNDTTIGDFAGWKINTNTPPCAIANSYYSGGNHAANAKLQSTFNMKDWTNVSMSFEQGFGYYYPTSQNDYFRVYVICNGTTQYLNMANFPEAPTSGNWTKEWATNTFDLSEYDGETVTIGFEYNNPGGDQSMAWEIRYFKIYDNTKAGVEGIEADENAPAVYYNLQGVRVAQPEKGIYIKVKGGKSSKVVF